VANKTPTETNQPSAETKAPVGESIAAAPETKPEAPKGPELLTPQAWGERLGLAQKADPARPWIEAHSDWRFAAAEKAHGWRENARAYQDEAHPDRLKLTEEDFNAALEAGAQFPAQPAHRPACGKGFEDRALTKKQLEKAKAEAEVKTNG
jgi:hypothetical protein